MLLTENNAPYPSCQAQLPTIPKIEFSPVDAWNSGKNSIICSFFLKARVKIYCGLKFGTDFLLCISLVTCSNSFKIVWRQ